MRGKARLLLDNRRGNDRPPPDCISIAQCRDVLMETLFLECQAREGGSSRLGVTLLIGVKDREVVQNRGDVGVLGSELLFVNLKRVQVIRLGRFLAA